MFRKFFNLKIISGGVVFVLFFNVVIIGFTFPQRKKAKAVCCIDSIGGSSQNSQLALDKSTDAMQAAGDKINTGANVGANIVTVETKAESWAEKGIHVASYIMMHQILNMITNDIIAWINGGGKPRFISDWKGFLTSAADKAAGAFLNELAGMNLCEPFGLDLRIALMPTTNFPEEVSCSFSEMGQFFDDFRNEGWKGWVKLTSPENNFYSAYFKGVDQRMSAEAAAEKAAENEGIASKGFLGVRCTPDLAAKSGCKAGEIVTPGEVISNMTNKTVSKDFDTIQASIANMTSSLGVFAPYVIAIGNALINRVIKEGLMMVAGGAEPEQLPIIAPDTTKIAQTTGDKSSGNSLVEQQKLLRDTINKDLKATQEENLTMLNKIVSIDKQIMNKIISISEKGGSAVSVISYTLKADPDRESITKVTKTDDAKITTKKDFLILSAANIGTADVEKTTITKDSKVEGIEITTSSAITAYYLNNDSKADSIQTDIQNAIQIVSSIEEAISATEKYNTWLDQNYAAISKTPAEITNLSSEEKAALDTLTKEGDTFRYNSVVLTQTITNSNTANLQMLAQEVQQITTEKAIEMRDLMDQRGDELSGGLKKEMADKTAILSSLESLLETLLKGPSAL